MSNPRTPYCRMQQAARLLAGHQSQLCQDGTVALIVDRRECGKPGNFLRAMRTTVHPTGTAVWWQPWAKGSARNVLVVTLHAHRPALEVAAGDFCERDAHAYPPSK